MFINLNYEKYNIFFSLDDSSRELSSPIHRTEEKFNAEEEVAEQKPSKRGARLDRLAALASTINNWEDDLSHPTLVCSNIIINILYILINKFIN